MQYCPNNILPHILIHVKKIVSKLAQKVKQHNTKRKKEQIIDKYHSISYNKQRNYLQTGEKYTGKLA